MINQIDAVSAKILIEMRKEKGSEDWWMGYPTLSDRTMWPINKCKKAMKVLRESGYVEQEPTWNCGQLSGSGYFLTDLGRKD